MKLSRVSELLMLLGLVLIAIAGFIIHTALGFFLTGAFSILIGALLFMVHLKTETNDKGGG